MSHATVSAVLACALLVMALLLVTTWAHYEALRDDVGLSCGGTVAQLDLTDWVPICRTVMPEDLDR